MSLRAPNEQLVSRSGRTAAALHDAAAAQENGGGVLQPPPRVPSRQGTSNLPQWAQRVQSRASEHVATRSEVNSDSDDDGTEEGEDKAAFSLLPKSILASVCIFGADGNLASKKILPTLFTLWKRKLVPKDIIIFGYARDLMDSEKFRKHVFRCIYNPTEAQAERKEFLKCCHYVGGEFDDEASFSALLVAMQEQELKRFNARPNILECTEQVRMYYMAVPPFLYAKVCSCLRSRRAAARRHCRCRTPPRPCTRPRASTASRPASAACACAASHSLVGHRRRHRRRRSCYSCHRIRPPCRVARV